MIIAIFHCYPGGFSSSARWSHGSRIWAECLGLINEDGIEVEYVDAVNSDLLPDPSRFQAIIITGSPSGVYERDSLTWISRLEGYLNEMLMDRKKTSPRVLGGCFGAQILGSSMGGCVEAQGYFVLATESLIPTPALAALPYAKGIIEEKNGKVIVLSDEDKVLEQGYARPFITTEEQQGEVIGLLESHGDCVRTLPPGSTLLASSATCVNELFICAEGRAIGIQGHPEFSLQKEIEEIIWPRQVDEGVKLSLEEIESSRASFKKPRHHKVLLSILRRFIFSNRI